MTTPEMRHEPAPRNAETAAEMDAEEITFEDLLTEQPGEAVPISSFDRLLSEGFPRNGGLAELTAIAQMTDSGRRFAAVRRGYLEILELQSRAQTTHLQAAAGTQNVLADRLGPAKGEAVASDPKGVV